MNDHRRSSNRADRSEQAEALTAAHLASAGWRTDVGATDRGADLVVRRGKSSYVVAVKAASEGRRGRLIPLWSQAWLEASRAAGGRHAPLAVVAAPRITPGTADEILEFAAEHVPDAAVGIIDFVGLRRFRGPHLEALDSEDRLRPAVARPARSEPADIFSDLGQWMLKVLLAPEVPEHLLAAPRGRYANASQLAAAADVSVMTAFRLVRQLEREGFLHEEKPHLSLVRREDLFRRWQAAAARRVRELPMRFVLRGDPAREIERLLEGAQSCLGLFAAADALRLGFVEGVPPHVYVHRLGTDVPAAWKNLAPAERGEVPDVILRQAPAPRAVFRGAVQVKGLPISDVLQVWLDVSSHPARGEEQAELIRRRVLDPVITGGGADG